MKTLLRTLQAGLGLLAVSLLNAGQPGVVNDPDGFTNLRAAQDAGSSVVARVPAGEVFDFEAGEGSPWWKVTLKSGRSGWMHSSRIMEHARMEDLQDGDPGDELTLYGKGKGIHYHRVAREASQGRQDAMHQYFALTDTDGGAAEGHSSCFLSVVHLLGDARWSAFLAGQPIDYQMEVRREYVEAMEMGVFEPFDYLNRHFPKTAAILFKKQLTAWRSPDGRLSVRKSFSSAEPNENSKVERASLVEVDSGNTLADFTGVDVGTGLKREGRVLWSSDSRRLAYHCAHGMEAQTVLYQAAGASRFEKVPMPEPELPGREGDAELRSAKRIYTHVEPLQWETPQQLLLRRHEYWEGKRPDGSINAIGRTYLITVSVAGGRASVVQVKVEER